ncbi:MAG: winged helix-turn-helix domain-containing protein [Acidobacteriaceae bacterium]
MADTVPETALRYRFGVFEADATTGELRRQGIRVRLNAQPFQVLLMLLNRPGELITREEISRELWPEGTFVDAEHGVNSAINRIRDALGDSAISPRFIETLARRGYRFVAPLQRIGSADPGRIPGPAEPVAEVLIAEPPQRAFDAAAIHERGVRPGPRLRILASPQELPHISWPVAQTLFLLLQAMYLSFYVGALANLTEIQELIAPLPRPSLILVVLIGTAALLIPVRAFVLCAVLFRAPRVREKILTLWRFLLPVDELWSLSPFLLLHHIDFGLALACTALLVWAPFVQRSLVLMGAGGTEREFSATAR